MSNSYELKAPCFGCFYGHNCKYFSNPCWFQWIIENNSCPAFTYTFDSIFKAIEMRKEELKKFSKYSSTPKTSSYDDFKWEPKLE